MKGHQVVSENIAQLLLQHNSFNKAEKSSCQTDQPSLASTERSNIARLSVFHKHWNKLHQYVYTTPEQCERDHEEWFNSIPSSGCGCMAHALQLIKKRPADFSSAATYFDWGVGYHNDVNESLGKPQFSTEEAIAKYNELCSG